MTWPTFNPQPPPSPNNSYVDRVPRILTSQFGDGYSQRSVDGVNSIVLVATLQWDILLLSELATIRSFMDATSYINPFYWTTFDDGGPFLFNIDWTNSQPMRATPINANTYSLRLILRQVFDLVQ
jgi:phage-related protein